MENATPDPSVILRVNIGCCKDCSRKLKKLLLTIDGVASVAVDREEEVAVVTGKVDPKILIKAVEKLGKRAELVTIKDPKKDKDQVQGRPNNNTQATTDKCPRKESVRQSGKGRKCCCNDSEPTRYNKKKDDDHKVEDYVAPPKEFDEAICRDPYCKIHKRNRIIHDHGPSQSGGRPMFWHYSGPGHEYFHRASNRPPYPHQPNPYEYYHPSMPQSTYGVHPGRPVPGFENFSNFFNDENTRSCTMM